MRYKMMSLTFLRRELTIGSEASGKPNYKLHTTFMQKHDRHAQNVDGF